jgi:hypothetical protein
MNIFSRKTIYYFLLLLIAVGIPLSKFLLSVAIILISILWIADKNFFSKLKTVFQKPSVWLLVSIYFIHIIGLIFTSDFSYGLKDLRIKLPLLVFPLIIGTSPSLNFKELKILIYVFITALLLNTLYCSLFLIGFFHREYTDIRSISVIMSHIRLSLLIVIGIFSAFYYLIYHRNKISYTEKVFLIFNIVWLSIFLIFLKSMTGIVIAIIFGYGLMFFLANKVKYKLNKYILKSLLIVMPIIILVYLYFSFNRYFEREKVDFTKLDKFSRHGSQYMHNTQINDYANGYMVWIYIADDELRREWNKRSSFKYDSLDKKGQLLRETLIKYMSSKGLRKDADGVAQLSDEDIKNIENGITNYVFLEKYSIYPKIYEILWEFEDYIKTGNPNGHSIVQRYIFLKTALEIISDNFWFGTGTGDVAVAFEKKYDEINSPLSEKFRLRAHNQYITFFLTFGVFGFLWILFAAIYPVFYEKKWHSYLFILIFVVSALSMVNEDTLETHIGVSLVSFFYSLFLFYNDKNYT